MAITILPRPERGHTWGDTLGQGVSAGLAALMEGKLQQMRRQYDYNAFEKSGLNPQMALLPQDARQEYVKNFFKQQGGMGPLQDYLALRNDALSRGVSPQTIQTTDAMSPKAGISLLNTAIKDVSKDRSPSGFFNWVMGGKAPSVYAATPQEQARYLAEQKQAQRQAQTQQAPSQTEIQQAQQAEYNVQAQANEDKKMQTTFDRVNQTAADQVAQGKPLGAQMTQEDYDRQLLEQMEADPTISPEELDFYRLNLTGGPKSFGEKVAGLPVNVLSGAAQTVGTGFGLLPAFESATNALMDFLPSADKYRDVFEKAKEEAPEGSQEKQNAESMLKQLDAIKQNKDKRIFPNQRDIKESVVRPVAKALGIERLTDVNDTASAIAERIGFVTPQMLISNIMGFAPGLARSAATAAMVESGSYAAEKLTGSPLVGALTQLLGYSASRFLPGTIQNYTSKGYKEFGKAIDQATEKGLLKKVDATPVAQAVEDLQNALVARNTPEAKFIKPIIEDLQRSFTRGGKLKYAISPKNAWMLDQELGGNTLDDAKKIGNQATKLLYQARNSLRQIYQPAMNEIDPKATQNLIASRNILAALNAKDIVQEKFAEAGKTNIGFFNKHWYSLKKSIQGLGQLLRFAKPYIKDTDYRKMTNNLVVQALTDNIPGVQKAVQTIIQETEKAQKEKKAK